jgi:hypothetical protein
MLHSLPGRVVTRDGVASLLYQATRSLQKKKKHVGSLWQHPLVVIRENELRNGWLIGLEYSKKYYRATLSLVHSYS